MKALGLNPAEQEMIDMTNEVNNNGLIYYPDFCKLVLRKYREESKGEIKNIEQNLKACNEIINEFLTVHVCRNYVQYFLPCLQEVLNQALFKVH